VQAEIARQRDKMYELVGLERDCLASGDTAGAENARHQVRQLRKSIKAGRAELIQLPTDEDLEGARSLKRHRSALRDEDAEVALRPVVRKVVSGGLPTLGKGR
jgi:hypothetical protein